VAHRGAGGRCRGAAPSDVGEVEERGRASGGGGGRMNRGRLGGLIAGSRASQPAQGGGRGASDGPRTRRRAGQRGGGGGEGRQGEKKEKERFFFLFSLLIHFSNLCF
jgi:hypothetical protein